MKLPAKRHIGPACKLGPGGDFICLWPADFNASSPAPASRLAKLLNTLSEIINTTLGSQYNPPYSASASSHKQTIRTLPKIKNLSAVVPKGRRRIVKDPLLFSSDCPPAASNTTRHKPGPKHLPSHRKRKKRTLHDLPGQARLFDDCPKKAISA